MINHSSQGVSVFVVAATYKLCSDTISVFDWRKFLQSHRRLYTRFHRLSSEDVAGRAPPPPLNALEGSISSSTVLKNNFEEANLYFTWVFFHFLPRHNNSEVNIAPRNKLGEMIFCRRLQELKTFCLWWTGGLTLTEVGETSCLEMAAW